MAKKKRKAPKKSPRPGNRPRPGRGDAVSLPDRRVLEGLMREVLEGQVGDVEDTPLRRAQQLVDRAYQAGGPEEQIALARQALEVSADCADAYVLLAENAGSR